MVKTRRRVLREINPQPLHARKSGRSCSISLGRMPDPERGHDRTVIIVVLKRRPAALEPVEPAIRFLNLPHAVEGLARPRMELSGGGGVVHRQGGSRRDHFGIPPRLCSFFSIVPVSNSLLEEAANLSHRRRRRLFENRPRHQVGIIGVASPALSLRESSRAPRCPETSRRSPTRRLTGRGSSGELGRSFAGSTDRFASWPDARVQQPRTSTTKAKRRHDRHTAQ